MRSLDCNGYSGTLAFSSTSSLLQIGDQSGGTVPASNIALRFSSTMTVLLTALGNITFRSINATPQTITTNGKILPNVSFNQTGKWQLLDALNTATSTSVTHTTGTLDTNSQAVNTPSFTSSTGIRTLTLGNSTITLSGANTALNIATTNLTITANTSTFILTGSSGSATLGAANYNGMSLQLNGSGVASLTSTATVTLANLTRTGTASKLDQFTVIGPVTVTGTVTLNGNSTANRLLVTTAILGSTSTITAAAVSASNVDFMDIVGAGAASWNLSAITGGSGDCWGNSGITFTTPTTQTNTGVTGNWSDATKWTSRIPLPQDAVLIPSGSGTVSIDMPRIGRDIDFTGFSGVVSWTTGLSQNIFGSYTMSATASYAFGNTVNLRFAGRGTHTLTSAGKAFNGTNMSSVFTGVGGTYTLQDTFSSLSSWSHNNGTLNTNNQTVSIANFSSSSGATRSLILGTTTFNVTGNVTPWNVSATGLTFSGANSTIVYSTASASARTFAGGSQTYGTLSYVVNGSTGQLTITGANSFAAINFRDTTNARTLVLPSSTTTTIRDGTQFNVNGTSGKLMSIIASTAGTAATLAITTGQVSVDFVSVKDSTGTTTTPLYAGANSTNVSNNTNWTFTAPPGGSTLTNTQTAKGRIQITGTSTQSALGRISVTSTKTQSSLARIAISATKTQPAKARISTTVTATQSAKANIVTTSVLTKTQTAVSRIQATVTKTQGAKANIVTSASSNKTQTAKARITNTISFSQNAVARISKSFNSTQTAKARITEQITLVQGAKARVQITGSATQGAKANIVNTSLNTKTQTAKARITEQITLTQSAKARVQITGSKTQTAIARITESVTKTQTAKGAIQKSVNLTQLATARVTESVTKTQTAKARISTSFTFTQPAKARISNTTNVKTQSAQARIQITTTKTQTSVARIQKSFTKTQTALGRITLALSATQPAKARIRTTATATQTAKAKIVNTAQRTATQTAKASIIGNQVPRKYATPLYSDYKATELFNNNNITILS